MIHRKPFLFTLALACALCLGACGKAPANTQPPAAPAETEKENPDSKNADVAAPPETEAPTPAPAPPPDISIPQDNAAAQSGEASGITVEEAEGIALEHAGVSREEVSYIRTELDMDNGVQEYEVEFYVGSKEYDYDIDAATGSIRNYDFEIENDFYHHNDRHHGGNSQGSSSGITEDEAKRIALAQVHGADSSHIRLETDYDDGFLIYEGKIVYNEMEYEFEIDAATGTILEWDAESVFD